MVGERIYELRQSEKITQSELALKIGKTQRNISAYEKETSEPDLHTLTLLAKHFRVSTDYLLGITDIPNFQGAREVNPFYQYFSRHFQWLESDKAEMHKYLLRKTDELDINMICHKYRIDRPAFLDVSSGSYRGEEYFASIQNQLSDIQEIRIYFDHMDAATDGFFVPTGRYYETDLYRIESPTFVVIDSNGRQFWSSNMNCGYGGTGPNTSIRILAALGIKKDLCDAIYDNRCLVYKKDDNNQFFIAAARQDEKFPADNRSSDGADLFFRDGALILLGNRMNRNDADPTAVFKRYKSFVGEVNEIRIIRNKEDIITVQSGTSSLLFGQKKYNFIVRGAENRQIWLFLNFNDYRPLKSQENFMKLVDLLEIDYTKDIAEHDNTDQANTITEMIRKFASSLFEVDYVNIENAKKNITIKR